MTWHDTQYTMTDWKLHVFLLEFSSLRNSLQFKVQYLYSKMMAQIPINVAYNIMQYAKNAT